MFMKATGAMTGPMEMVFFLFEKKVCILTWMGPAIWAGGLRTNNKVTGSKAGQMAQNTKAIIKKVRNMEMGLSIGQMVHTTTANLIIIIFMGRVCMFGLMVENTSEIGKITKWMEKVLFSCIKRKLGFSRGLTAESMKASILMTRKMGSGLFPGTMVENTEGNG